MLQMMESLVQAWALPSFHSSVAQTQGQYICKFYVMLFLSLTIGIKITIKHQTPYILFQFIIAVQASRLVDNVKQRGSALSPVAAG